MNRETFTHNLQPFLPIGTTDMVFDLVKDVKLKLKITKSRSTKFGDYRSPYKVDYHTITINGNMNPLAFLITLVHEIAHLKVYLVHKNQVSPHGIEWKSTFKDLMIPFLNPSVFPDDILRLLAKHMINPKASTTSDVKLYAALKALNKEPTKPMVSQLNIGDVFMYKNGKFERGEKRRTRIICFKYPTKKPYLFSPLTEVEII